MKHQLMEHQSVDHSRNNHENPGADGKADAISAVALILMAVAIAVYWVAGQ